MKIPLELLDCPTTIQDVEERLAEEGAPDLWLEQWHLLVSLMEPGDELWEYCGMALADDRTPGAQNSCHQEFGYDDSGFALVRGVEVIDAISVQSLW